MMNIKPIHTKVDHKAALRLVSRLADLDPAPGTPDGGMPEVMSTPVAACEARHFPIESADPIEAIKFRTDQQRLAPHDLEPMIGRIDRVYEVLAERRRLTMAMAWRLHQQLGVPAKSLIRPPKLAQRSCLGVDGVGCCSAGLSLRPFEISLGTTSPSRVNPIPESHLAPPAQNPSNGAARARVEEGWYASGELSPVPRAGRCGTSANAG